MPHLIGPRVMLREYRIEDVPKAREWVNDAAVTANLSHLFLPPQTWDMTEEYYQRIVNGQAPGYHFIIAQADSQRYIGQIDLFAMQEVDRTAEMGIVIAGASDRGIGVGKEAIGLLLEFAFRQANLHKIELQVLASNLGAIRCYEACGFVHEGCRRKKRFRDGAYQDLVLMGILREEWEARQQ